VSGDLVADDSFFDDLLEGVRDEPWFDT